MRSAARETPTPMPALAPVERLLGGGEGAGAEEELVGAIEEVGFEAVRLEVRVAVAGV